ncbi:hypothetical protein G169_gp16 [Pseudomonas phage AF]|uniref:hypothetical protein n=1 Tax=Pseudomonas phage AF TaxID=1235689 RepID=UPI000297139D|nr:hypothetical protein G169_gp16 [Pseudomonas phage AF]AFV50631.1 hypothetical protein AF_016 [Pseudomonas phage AF]
MIQVPELLKPVDSSAIPQPETPPSKTTQLADAARDFAQSQSQDFVHSMETVSNISPDAYAKATAVSRYSGVPAKVLHDNADRMNQLLRGNQYAGIYTNYRKTANALRDGNLAAVSQDDLDQLVRIEGAASDTRFNQQSTGEKLFGAVRQQWVAQRQAGRVADAARLNDIQAQFDRVDLEVARAAEAGEQPFPGGDNPTGFGFDYLQATPEQRQQMRERLVGRQTEQLQRAAQDEQTLSDMPVDPGARRAAELESLGRGSLSATAEALAENPGYAFRTSVGAAATSAEMLAAGAIAGPVAAAGIGFSGEYQSKLLDVLREAKVNPNDPKAVLRALQDDKLMADAERRASLKAAGTTAVDLVSMGLASNLLVPSRIAGRQLTRTQRELANLAVQFPVQGIGEGASEAAGQFAAEGKVDAGEVLLEAVAGAGMSSLDVLAFSNRRLIEGIGDGLRRARETREGQLSLDEMVDASLSSKTRGREADTFGDIAKAQLADTPMETLWIPAEALTRLNQDGKANLPELMLSIPGMTEQFADASARGGSVAIKTADYLRVFADYHQDLSQSIRTQADGMSPADVEAWTADQEAQLDDLGKIVQQNSPETNAYREVVDDLVASGYRRADAEQYASVHLSVLSNLAERTGQALEQIRQQFPLTFTADQAGPQQGRRLDQFAGQTAWSADMPSLADAEQRIADGDNAEQVRRETGWSQGADGKWRFEIDDSQAQFAPINDWLDDAEVDGVTLGEALNHPALFAAYPELAQVQIRVNPARRSGGMFVSQPGRGFVGSYIEIGDPTLYSSDSPAIDVVMHEVQHAIQVREGFATGGSEDAMRADKDQAMADRDYWRQVADLRREIDSLGEEAGRQAFIDTFERTPTEQQMQDALATDLPQIEQRAADAEQVMRDIGNPETTYRRLAGEVEARNTERRRTMTAEERQAASPEQTADTPSDQAIVRWNGTEMNSAAVAGQRLLNQNDNGDARGFITFTPRGEGDRRFQISLGDKRDLSTVLHELGHYYLEVIDQISTNENAPEQIKDDVSTIRAWLGAEEGDPITTEQHEQFARGFESYLAEGKAPSPELAGAFARFKRWLIQIYKDLRRLNVTLTDDVRRVFDRLVATDEQITAAEQVTNALPLFADAAAAGMTEQEFVAYQNSIDLAHADARDSIEEEIVREEERRRSKWWREESSRVRDEVTEEIDTLPEYAALKALRKGQMPDGTDLTIKLNSGELAERYGAKATRKLAFTHARDGQPLDVVGPMLGYDSGDQLVKALLGAEPRSQVIKRETDQRMLERHGPKSTGEAAERAIDATHNERRAEVLQKELRRLAQVGNRKNITTQQILKEASRRVMLQRKVRDIQPAEFQRAEAKAGRQSYEAFVNGDLEAAYEAKQRQLLNFYMYREARKAREQVEDITARMLKYNKASTRERLGKAGHDYLDQIDAVMEQYEFRKVSLREVDKRKSFAAWYADQLAMGNEPIVPEFVLNTSQRVNYKDLSLDQLQELDEFVANVNHLASTKNKLLANKRLKDFEEAKNNLIRAGYANLEKRTPPPVDKNTRTLLERIGDQAGELSAALIKMEQVVEWLDGGQVDGPWSTAFFQPFVEAQGAKDQLNRDIAIKMTEIVDAYTKERGAKVMQQKIHIQSLGQPLTMNAILSAALNTGNASNRKKLLDGGHNGKAWTEQQLNEITGNLTKRDWEFVQSMWDLVEELWPSIVQLEKDLHGVPPEKVEATPVVTQHGTFRGGYWPLVYDTSSSAYAGVQNELGNEGGLFEQGYARATTPKGHTKARVDSFAAPIQLDVEIIASHLGQVIHDLTHRKAIRDAAKIIGDKQIKQMLIDTLGPAVANQFNPWLQGVANDMVLDSQKGIDAWTRGAERLRANLAVGFMGFSATTGLQQILGYSQSFEYFSKVGGKRYIFQGMQEFIRHPFESIEMVNQMSSEMRFRVDNLDRDMRGVLKKISGKSDWLSFVQRLAFKHIGVIQAMVDYPTWIAGYRHGLDSGLDGEQAIAAGDRAVRLSQMAAGPKDLAAVQRKDGLMRALTIVYSYFNLLYNRTVDIKRAFSSAKGAADYLNVFERTMFLIAIPAVIGPLVSGQGPGEDEDWRAWASLKIATYPLLGIPLVRDLASSLESGWAYKGATPIGEVFNTLSKAGAAGKSAAEGKDVDTARAAGLAIDTIGYSFGLPVAQPKRTVKYLIGVAEGDIEPEGVTDWTRGVIFGPPKK